MNDGKVILLGTSTKFLVEIENENDVAQTPGTFTLQVTRPSGATDTVAAAATGTGIVLSDWYAPSELGWHTAVFTGSNGLNVVGRLRFRVLSAL